MTSATDDSAKAAPVHSASKPAQRRVQHARFVVSVDRQIKSSFNKREDADTEAARITAKFANLTVQVSDTENSLIRESDTPATREPAVE